MPFKSCTHVKADGLRCGSPALRGQSFCYFHHHSADHRPRTQARVVNIPFPENAAAIQVAIHNVMLAIIDRRIDERRANQLLWALQIAAGHGRQLPFDNSTLMSLTVTELPDYELEAAQQQEEERRLLDEFRTNEVQRQQAAAQEPIAPLETIVVSSPPASVETAVVPSSPAPVKTAVIPSPPAPAKTTVIPSEAALFGEVEGPCVPPHQHDADAPPPPFPPTADSCHQDGSATPSPDDPFIDASDLDLARSGDWQAVDRLFRAVGLIPSEPAT